MFDKMKMKEALLDELLEEMDEQESGRLKPKAAMIAVGHESPVAGDDMGMPEEEDDDDLKMLLQHYMKG